MPKILIVDDSQDNIYLLKVILESKNFQVVEANSGEEALEVVARESPDLLLLDIMMTGMSGFDVCRQLREDQENEFLPIILITARKDKKSKLEGLETGANDYITKPFDRDEVLARIHSLLTIKQLQEKLISTERRAVIGEMQVTLNHEINNPLAAIMGNTELLLMEFEDKDPMVTKKLNVILGQTERIRDIVQKIKNVKVAAPTTYLNSTKMIDLNS